GAWGDFFLLVFPGPMSLDPWTPSCWSSRLADMRISDWIITVQSCKSMASEENRAGDVSGRRAPEARTHIQS
ncbi:hypothetical protein B0T09DRAFT_350184, partial [Sordaria sp. MPI-SDFR-AT-0083]